MSAEPEAGGPFVPLRPLLEGLGAVGEHPWTPRALTVVGLGLALWNAARLRFFVHDDAYISLRYVRHLVEHGDLSWNLGERVEGYTNFLHLLATAGLVAGGFDPVTAARSVNGASVLLLVVFLVAALRSAQPPARGLVALLLLSSYSLVVWTYGALEPVMTTALLAGAAWLGLRGLEEPSRRGAALGAGALYALAYLTRPDALVQGVAAGLAFLALAQSTGKAPTRQKLTFAALLALAPAVTVAAHVTWRLGYYGDTLPNTFHAKVGVPISTRIGALWTYLPESLLFLPALGLSLGALVLLATRGGLPRRALWLGFVLAAHVAYVVWSGGDHMPASRVLLPTLGPALLLLATLLPHLMARSPRGALPALALVAITTSVASPTLKEDPPAFIGKIVGNYMAAHWPPGSLVALSAAGAGPYVARDLAFVDMLGLSDRVIGHREDVPLRLERQRWPGHAKGDGAYVLARQPDYVILGIAEGLPRTRPWFLSDLELAESPEFARCYAERRVQIAYDVPPAERQQVINPLNFIYFERTCPRTVRRTAPWVREPGPEAAP